MLTLPKTAGPKRSGSQVTSRLRGASRIPSSLSERNLFRLAPAALDIAHDDEVPGLGETHARRVMGRDEHTSQDLVGNRIGQKFPHVTAAEDCLVEPAFERSRERMTVSRRHAGEPSFWRTGSGSRAEDDE